jgi:predicted GIY-YIG superfamily endonuclease
MKILNTFEIDVKEYESINNFCTAYDLRTNRWDRNWFVYVMCLDANVNGEDIIPLYVGQTCNIKTRIAQHQSKPWFTYVDFILVEEFVSPKDARNLEKELIEKTRPVFNLQVSKRKRAKKYLPKMAAVHGVKALMSVDKFNGDEMYDWVTKELPTIDPIVFP